jgi:hypothetical protein
VTDLQRIPPDVEADIELALTELDRSVLEARIHDDPLRLPLSALASFLRAQRGLYADSIVTMQRSIETARQPVRDDHLRRAVVQGISSHASGAVRTMGWRNVLLAASILVASIVAGAGGGYWFGYRLGLTETAPLAGLAPAEASAWSQLMHNNSAVNAIDVCENGKVAKTPDGRRACALPMWLDPPARTVPAVSR